MKFPQKNMLRLGAIILGLVVLVAVVNAYSGAKGAAGEGYEVGGLEPQGPLSNDAGLNPMPANTHAAGGNAASSLAQESRHPTDQQTYSQTVLSPEELLPKGGLGASWAATNPAGLADLKGQTALLSPGYHYGINTVGQTLRNANLDLRSDPPNPRKAVGPFLNSTIEPDLMRRQLELGEA
jgi:hypothetical protein